MDPSAAIRRKVIELGLDLVGVTDASPIESHHARRLKAWLDAGCAGQMHFMRRHLDRRLDPGQLLPGAKSVIVVGLHYKPPATSPPPMQRPAGRVAQYALYEDYHGFLKGRLHDLAVFVASVADQPARFKVCVDSAPLLERALATRAGLGFIARHHMLTHTRLGPQIFLGELMTTASIPLDEPCLGDCGDCDRCIRACPTGALRADGLLDARRCINYLTIEHAGPIPADLAARIGDRVYGCDECVLVCPFQEAAPARDNPALRFYPDRTWLDLADVLALTEETFALRFAGSPIARIGLPRLQRNAQICMDNTTRSQM